MREATLWLLSLLFSVNSLATSRLPPVNPFLADSPWPMSHRHPYSQASSALAGPQQKQNFRVEHLALAPGIVTLAMDKKNVRGEAVIWASSLRGIHKLLWDGQELQTIDSMSLISISKAGALTGAYTLVDHQGHFFVPKGRSIYAFASADPEDAKSKIQLLAQLDLEVSKNLAADDAIVGLNLTYDGYLAFVSMHGVVGVVSRDFTQLHLINLPKDERISNSIAIDEDGGIYVVTSKLMRRVQWTRASLSIDEADGAWSAPYDTGDDETIPGRLGQGSGSTPTLMGQRGDDQLVVITDGAKLMRLVYFWRNQIPQNSAKPLPHLPRIAGQIPIRFGRNNIKQTTTEQSVLVYGYDALVVNNDYGLLKNLPVDLGQIGVVLTNLPGIAPHGVEKFRWNAELKQPESVWANQRLSCPNGIPSYSTVTNLAYCIGQRRGRWTLEGIDWETGDSRFYAPLGYLLRYNSAYAATQIGYDGVIFSGGVMGAFRVDAQ